MHATDKDCHELLDYICTVAKPRKMEVQMYYSCLHKLNHQVKKTPLVLIFLEFFARNKRLLLVASIPIKSISVEQFKLQVLYVVTTLSHVFTRKYSNNREIKDKTKFWFKASKDERRARVYL
jgi:hypothetical protein